MVGLSKQVRQLSYVTNCCLEATVDLLISLLVEIF